MKIGVLQLNNSHDIEDNINKIKYYMNTSDVKYFVLPEAYLTGYTSKKEYLAYLELDDKRLLELRDFCFKKDIHLFVGAIIKEHSNFYISYLYINKDIKVYHKTHLGKNEQLIFTEGNELKIFNADFKFSQAICIESHFHELIQTLSIKGAEVVLIPFASPKRAGNRKEIWMKYLPARAYDNKVYVIAVNLVGSLEGLSYSGGTLVIDPKGNILYEYFKEDEHMSIIEVDKAFLEKVKANKKTDYIKRRRTELYKEE